MKTLLYITFIGLFIYASPMLLAQIDSTATEEKGVLKNPKGFEMFGEEEEETTPIAPATPNATPATVATPESSPAAPYIEQNPFDSTMPTTTTSTTKKKKVSKPKRNGSELAVDLDAILYDIEFQEAVEVKAVRGKNMTFKQKEDNKYYYNQAILRVSKKDYGGAIDFLDKCIKADPYNKELLQLRGNAYTEVGKYKSAVRDFQIVTQITSTDPVVYYNYATTLSKMGHFEESIKMYDQAILLRPDYLYALQGRASTKTMSRNFEGAVEDYNGVLELNSTFTPALRGRGVAKAMLSLYDEAINDFTSVTELTPSDGLSYYYRGLAYSATNMSNRACSDFEKAYQLRIEKALYELEQNCK